MKKKTIITLLLVGMALGYLLGLWHQLAQRSYRAELEAYHVEY